MNIDKGFLSLLIERQDKALFKKAIKQISPDYLEGEEREIYKWIANYYKESKGNLPSKTALKIQFPNFNLYKNITDSLEFFVSKLKERKEYQLFSKYITNIGNSLFSEDLEKAKILYRELGQKLSEDNELEKISSIKETLKERHINYLKAKKNKGKIGYFIGIPTIDKHIGGLNKEFFIIAGRQGVGKTFLSLYMACSVWKEINKPILIVSNEMPTNEIYSRIDSIMANINASKYRKGLLSKEEEKRLIGLKDLYDKLPDLYVINGAGMSANDVEYEIVAIDPGLLVIDGIYLTDMGKNDFVADTIAASRAYQRINKKYNLPIIATSQLSKDNGTKYARALQEDADIVLSMFQNQHLKDINMMRLYFYKIRHESSDVEAYMNWDFENWNFGEVENYNGLDYSIIETT